MCLARNYTTQWCTRPEKKKNDLVSTVSLRNMSVHVSAAPTTKTISTSTHLFVLPLSAVYVSVKYRSNTDAVWPWLFWSQKRHNTTVWTDSRQGSRNETRTADVQRGYTATSVSSSILITDKGVSLLQTKKNCLPVLSAQLHTLKNLEQIC